MVGQGAFWWKNRSKKSRATVPLRLRSGWKRVGVGLKEHVVYVYLKLSLFHQCKRMNISKQTL